MASRKKTDQLENLLAKVGGVVLALVGLAVCGSLFLLFYKTEAFPREVRILFMICDGLMVLAILWLLRRFLKSVDER
ncbi:MAG: hypothetical protein IJ091_06050 [Oscillospiraceae bacterium]|nr:hypothetical protein [Oscillospiraceae bacterium]